MRSLGPKPAWLSFAIGLVGIVMGLAVWHGLAQPAPAFGQIPDEGAQRKQIIAELQASNKKLGEIAELLKEIRNLAKEDKP